MADALRLGFSKSRPRDKDLGTSSFLGMCSQKHREGSEGARQGKEGSQYIEHLELVMVVNNQGSVSLGAF